MIPAYNRVYLADAEDTLAGAFDYAVNSCGFDGDEFARLFVITGYSRRFECGNPAVVAGMSGVELADNVFLECGMEESISEPKYAYEASAEYWAGWVLAQYQWQRAYSFKNLFARLPFSRITSLYSPYHEADVTRFFEAADEIIAQTSRGKTNLSRIRKSRGMSQKSLSLASGVGIKTIQAYEQRINEINKAQVGILVRLARTLGCSIEDLLEFAPSVDMEYAG